MGLTDILPLEDSSVICGEIMNAYIVITADCQVAIVDLNGSSGCNKMSLNEFYSKVMHFDEKSHFHSCITTNASKIKEIFAFEIDTNKKILKLDMIEETEDETSQKVLMDIITGKI